METASRKQVSNTPKTSQGKSRTSPKQVEDSQGLWELVLTCLWTYSRLASDLLLSALRKTRGYQICRRCRHGWNWFLSSALSVRGLRCQVGTSTRQYPRPCLFLRFS